MPISQELNHKPLSEQFADIIEQCKQKKFTYQDFLNTAQKQGQYILILFLSTPFLLPIPIPGLSIPFGIVITLTSLSSILQMNFSIPKKWQQKKIPQKLFIQIFSKAKIIIIKFEKLIKPRLQYLNQNTFSLFISKSMICICGILLSLPLPPGTNFPPALCIVFLTTALLENDGFILILGFFIFLLNILFFTFLYVAGMHSITFLIKYFS